MQPRLKGSTVHRGIALTSVMSKWYASCIFLRLEKAKGPEKGEHLHIGGVEEISCQHLQVMVTNLLQKQWEWQEEGNPAMRHGTVVRPTMYMACLDIKTAFDEAKPKRVAKVMDDHNTHEWIIAALLRMAKPSLNVWKAGSLSIAACDKEAWKPHACGKRWLPRYWQMWRKNG